MLEPIDQIDVFETEGTGKNRTKRIVIYYQFVGSRNTDTPALQSGSPPWCCRRIPHEAENGLTKRNGHQPAQKKKK